MPQDFLDRKLQDRFQRNAYRRLQLAAGEHDFFSNDYLGISRNGLIDEKLKGNSFSHGSTGSRLLAGNYPLIEETERMIANFHESPSALIFNSGYDANLGLLSCIAERGDTILYDKLSHASIRDGVRLSQAQAFSFGHNDLEDLKNKLLRKKGECFVVTESVFSMDGDMAPVREMLALCESADARLIVDEAHATGVVGNHGEGLIQHEGIHHNCFARIITFGKALGCHGAAILSGELLRNFLINFSRSFIFTTALPPVAIAAIKTSYEIFPDMHAEREQLKDLIRFFRQNQTIHTASGETYLFKESGTPVQGLIVPGNAKVKAVASQLGRMEMDVRPILYPTVPEGEERLRIALHSFNSVEEAGALVSALREI